MLRFVIKPRFEDLLANFFCESALKPKREKMNETSPKN